MIAQLALTASLAGMPVIRPGGNAGATARYVRLSFDVDAYGVPGHGEIVVDRATGDFVRRFDAGPVSEREGWDGTHAWRADATGMARIEGNVDERGAIIVWSRLLAPVKDDEPCTVCGSRPPDVTVATPSGFATAVVRHVGEQTERTTLADYRRDGNFVVPHTITDTSENGTWELHVRTVETPAAVAASTFAPPPPPHDATIDGVATGPLLGPTVIPTLNVSVNGGAPLRFALDTGGQNVISPDAARKLGMEIVGNGTVGGAGAGLAKIQYAWARTVAVGSAQMRDQPFLVLDLGKGIPFDGIVGYELLARFAVRLDFAHERYAIAADAHALGDQPGTDVPMVFDDRQPQVDGVLDGIPGAVTIDTGSASALDVNAPFAIAHDLRTKYHAVDAGSPIAGVGGPVHAYLAKAEELELGAVRFTGVPLLLTDATAGAEANPTVAANVGDQVLRRYNLLLDYRRDIVRFESPGR
ncbi:MAG TPA: pepsin/retropepsin-like aspartic protease family protein [Candidatus Elarobacter sp.]|nr:pepsin/retropepsin-like aspartic protease family protein [Candidatus Elarobacter sp.]